MERLNHHCSHLANSTLEWWPTDTKDLYLKNLNDPTQQQKLEQYGWINADISYQHNSHGFRTDEFDQTESCVVVGCSITYGTGLPVEKIWPTLLSQMLGLKVYNLGIGGASSDTCYRVIEHYVPFLKPKFVVLLEPDVSRLEIFINNNPVMHLPSNPDPHGFTKGNWLKTWYTSNLNLQTHSQKNVNAMAYICQKNQADFFCYRHDFFPQFYNSVGGLARDLQHPGVEFNQALAERIFDDIVNKRTYE